MRGKSPDTFRALGSHVQFAVAYLELLAALRESIERHDGLTRCAHDFVWFAVRGFRDAAVNHLYRLYDTSSSGISLSKYIRATATDESERDKDLQIVSKDAPLVKKLLRLRHEAFGHTSENVVVKGTDKYVDEFPLSEDDLRELLARAKGSLERYSGEPMPLLTPARFSKARSEVKALSEFLKGAMPGRHGLQRIVLEQDGRAKSKGIEL